MINYMAVLGQLSCMLSCCFIGSAQAEDGSTIYFPTLSARAPQHGAQSAEQDASALQHMNDLEQIDILSSTMSNGSQWRIDIDHFSSMETSPVLYQHSDHRRAGLLLIQPEQPHQERPSKLSDLDLNAAMVDGKVSGHFPFVLGSHAIEPTQFDSWTTPLLISQSATSVTPTSSMLSSHGIESIFHSFATPLSFSQSATLNEIEPTRFDSTTTRHKPYSLSATFGTLPKSTYAVSSKVVLES